MSAPTPVVFDLTILDAVGVPWFGTIDVYGEITESDFQTPDPTLAHDRPYLLPPENFSATEIDFLAGSSRIGAVSVGVLDTRLTATDQTTGQVTSRIAEAVGSRAIMRRWDGAAWVRIWDGVVQSYSVDSEVLLIYWFHLRDAREGERAQPLFLSNFVLFGAAGATGPAIDYGALPGGGFLLDAVAPFESIAAGTISHFQAFTAEQGISFGYTPLPAQTFIDLQDRGLPVQDIDGFWYYRGVQIQWREKGSADPWTTLRDMPAIGGVEVIYRPNMGLGFASIEYFTTPTLYFGSFDAADIPATGQEIEFHILAVDVTKDAPFFWDGGSFGDLLREISDGDHSPDGRAQPYSVAGMDAFAAATPAARVILTEPVADRKKWVEANIYQATGFAPAFDAEQKVYPVSWALPENTVDIPVIEVNSLVPLGEWTHDSEGVVNTVDYTYLRESVADQETTQQKTGKRKYILFGPRDTTSVEGTLSQWDRYFTTPVTTGPAPNAASVATFGTRALSLAPVTVRSIGDVDGRPISGDIQDEAGAQLAMRVGGQAILRWKRGAPAWQGEALASDPIVAALKVGDFVLPRLATMPDHNTGTRLPPGLMQVAQVNDANPAVRSLLLVACGVADLTDGADAACLTGGLATFLPDGSTARVYLADGSLVNACAHPVTVQVLLIAGGGGGGTGGADNTPGGGGAGGVLEAVDVLIAASTTIPITVGLGGAFGGFSGEDTVLWAAPDGTALVPGVDPPPALLRAIGGGGGGNADGAGQSGGSGGGGGETLPISGGSNTPGGPGTAGQGTAGGDGNSAGGESTCQEAAGGGGGSYGGAGGAGNSGTGGGVGGPSMSLPEWGVTAGGGGSGPWLQVAAGSGGLCAVGFVPGVGGTGYGAGGGGGSGAGLSGILVVSYEGAAPALPVPTVTSTTLEADGRVTVCVEEADWPIVALEDYRVRVDYATGATEPAATSGDWRLAGYLESPGCVTTPPVPTGATVWSRATAEASAFLPSEPTTAEDLDTPETPGLLAYQLTIDADGVATVTWTPNAFAGIVRIRGLIHDDAGDVDRPLAFIADVLSAVGTYTLPGVVAQEEFYTLDLEAWSDAVPPTGNAALLVDQFTRADNSAIGGTWTQHGNGWSITSNRVRNDGANGGALAESTAASVSESFVQAVVQSNVITSGYLQLVARHLWISGTSFDGYILSPGADTATWRLEKVAAGVFSALDSDADATLASATDYQIQLYVADGIQEGWGNGHSVNAADATYNGLSRNVALRKHRLAGNVVALGDDFLWFATKYVTVRDLPIGWKAKVLNAAAGIVATATETAGVARVDCSRYGAATEAVPVAGWDAVIVTDAADVEQARYDAAGIYPGLDGTYVGGTISGVSGIGSIYRASTLQPATTTSADATALQGFPISPTDPTDGQALVLVAGVYTPADIVTQTELAAWPGSTSITTLGTIATGTVPAARISAGTFQAGDFVFAGAVSGITTLTNTDLVGLGGATSADAQVNITPAVNLQGLRITGYSLTGSDNSPLLNLAGTWNTSGTPTGILLGITDTASAAASLLLALAVGGSNRLTVQKDGQVRQTAVSAITNLTSSIGSELVLRNIDATAGNFSSLTFQNSNSTAVVRICGVNVAHSPAHSDLAFMVRAAGGSLTERMRLLGTGGDLALSPLAKLRFDGVAGGGDTDISESGTNVLTLRAGGVALTLSSVAAAVTLSAGTTTRTPLLLVSGPVLTTPVAGAVEFLTDNLHLTITTGVARKGVMLDDGARLTSGRTPKATTNGRLIDGPAAVASGGALAAYATGAFGLDSGANMAALHALVVTIRAALVADGTLS